MAKPHKIWIEQCEAAENIEGELVQTTTIRNRCAHCEKELNVVNDHRSHLNLLYNLHVFSCPHCRKVLGISTLLK